MSMQSGAQVEPRALNARPPRVLRFGRGGAILRACRQAGMNQEKKTWKPIPNAMKQP